MTFLRIFLHQNLSFFPLSLEREILMNDEVLYNLSQMLFPKLPTPNFHHFRIFRAFSKTNPYLIKTCLKHNEFIFNILKDFLQNDGYGASELVKSI
jgi:hypothetical protein